MRLILFSGGVESTALMTLAKPGDLALILQPTFSTDVATYRKASAEAISKHFGVKLAYASFSLPDLEPHGPTHQMTAFISACNMVVARGSNVTEIWCGRNSSEPTPNIKNYIDRHMAAWAWMHPNVPFLHPLDHLTKREQWEMIPAEVRPLVSSCVYHSMCGQCYKCKEWVCLSENSL